jgi:histidyl-tRNA synthetase
MISGLPGFRDFFPEECARRNHIVSTWRNIARRYGFVEFDGPVLECTDLYRKKNDADAEILQQLYSFTDRGGREVALRPEMTPTLARMVAAREKHYRRKRGQSRVLTLFKKSESFQGWQGHYESNMRGRFIM